MSRLKLAILLIGLISVGATLSISFAQVQIRDPLPSKTGRIATLKDQLEKGLRARLPAEFAYINAVLQKVQQGRLSTRMVLSTFDYARRRNRRRPFPYFERALGRQATRLGVQLPTVYR